MHVELSIGVKIVETLETPIVIPWYLAHGIRIESKKICHLENLWDGEFFLTRHYGSNIDFISVFYLNNFYLNNQF